MIRVVGVGGAGLNAVNRMIDAGISQVEFVAVNTDMQQLQMRDAPVKIHIGRELTQGLGSGADPDIGRRAAEECYDQIKRALRGSDMVFVTAGEGGGTGSGAAPVVARIARELGALTVGIVTTPFKFEGTRRQRAGRRGRRAAARGLRHDDRRSRTTGCSRCSTASTSMLDAFRIADDVLRQGVQGICDLITMPGLINLDFADVRTIMKDAGSALMGIGFSADRREPRQRGRRARAPLAADRHRDRRRARASCSRSRAATTCRCSRSTRPPRSSAQAATDDTNIIFGATVDDRLTGQVWVTVVATGLGGPRRSSDVRRSRPRRRTRTRSSRRASCSLLVDVAAAGARPDDRGDRAARVHPELQLERSSVVYRDVRHAVRPSAEAGALDVPVRRVAHREPVDARGHEPDADGSSRSC